MPLCSNSSDFADASSFVTFAKLVQLNLFHQNLANHSQNFPDSDLNDIVYDQFL